MRLFLMILMLIPISFGSLYSMDGLYIKRTLPIVLRWKSDDKRRTQFVRACVTHLYARSGLYEEWVREARDQKRKDYLKSEIQQDMELLEGLAQCDFTSYLPEGARAHDRLEKLEKELV